MASRASSSETTRRTNFWFWLMIFCIIFSSWLRSSGVKGSATSKSK